MSKAKLATLTNKSLDKLWDEAMSSHPMTFLPWSRLPDCNLEMLTDFGIVDDEGRIKEIRNGAQISEKDKEEFQDTVIPFFLDDEEADSMGLVEVKGKFVLLSTPGGYIFDRGAIKVEGILDSKEEALKYLDTQDKYE